MEFNLVSDDLPESGDFDYVIVGAGAAGCIVANRLSADPYVKVALIEAGPSDREFPVNWKTSIPIGNIFLLPFDRYNWKHEFKGEGGVDGRTIACPRGRLLGGSTSVNGTVYIRGHRLDFDDWAALGNHGWAYSDVLAAFKRHENRGAGADSYHSTGGELDVQRLKEPNPLAEAFVSAGVAAGYARNSDFNGAEQDGFGLFELNQRNGQRLSSSRAFLHPIIERANLKVFTNALVERIELRGARATGVTLNHFGRRRTLDARREVVLCGGAVNSPQLLMLSGIGPKDALEAIGIRVNHAMPGVGENLQDHPSVSVCMHDSSATSYALSWRSASKVMAAPFKYVFGRRGMLASNAAEAGGFIRSSLAVDRPDIQLTFMVGLKENAKTMPRRHGFVCHVAVQQPKSRGKISLASADPLDKPVIRPRFLEDERDIDLMMHGLSEARRVLQMGPLQQYGGREIAPGEGVTDDAALRKFVKATAGTTYHPVGTCKMGPSTDPLAVVDSKLRVHGIEGLRIADASVMPIIVSGNTAASSMMIGERAAEFILEGSRSFVSGAGPIYSRHP